MDLVPQILRFVDIRFEVLLLGYLFVLFELGLTGLVGMFRVRVSRVFGGFMRLFVIQNGFLGFRMRLFRFRILCVLIDLIQGLVSVVNAAWQSNAICAAR